MRNKIKNSLGRLSYKYLIVICLSILVSFFVIVFSLYSYYNYKEECRTIAGQEAEHVASRIVSQVDERLDKLKQYYITAAEDDEIKWALENPFSYSEYDHRMAVKDLLSSTKLFGDYISGYTFVNFRTEWIHSNKGLYKLDEAYNGAVFEELLNYNSQSIDQNYWLYDYGNVIETTIDRNYRVTIETNGLSFVMKLPAVSSNIYGLLIVNVDMNQWKQWISQWLDAGSEVVVLDESGQVIYATNVSLVDSCQKLQKAGETASQIKVEGASSYMAAARKSEVLGWNYYICYDLKAGQFSGTQFPILILLTMLILVILILAAVGYTIYLPVNRLVRNVSEGGVIQQQITGNEFEFLTERFVDLKDDCKNLQAILEQNQTKLQELFELRLIRGEVRTDDEWSEYVEELHLRPCRYFAAAVMVLNLKGESEAQSNVNEDAICLKIVEELPEALKAMTWMPPVYNACTISCIFGENDEDILLKRIIDFYDGIQAFTEEAYGYRILMGVSANHTNHQHISGAYRESVNALTMENKGYFMEEQTSAALKDKREDCHFFLSSTTVRVNSYNDNFEKEIQAAIKAVDKEQCYKVVDDFCFYLKSIPSHDEATVYILRMINTILLTAINTKLELGKLYPDGLRKIYREMIEAIEPSRVRRYMKVMLIDPIIQARNELLENNSYSMLEEIERKIAESKGNITLTECAEALGVHPTYIWKVLKMEKGKLFSDYLEEYKLDEAKRLLLQTSMSVAEIATELNYTNAQNFIRFFSKRTGVTPGKFRKL